MRRTITTILAVLLAVAVLGGVAAVAAAGGGGSTVTRARLERSLPDVFSNLYVQQAHLLGHSGVTPKNLHAKAMCDKHGPDVADVGPGGDWICLMSWTDSNVPMPSEGYGKFELNVHSNDCYTAAGPSKLTGFLNLTDRHGREVANPVFEFDGCFDPATNNTATGVHYPSVLAISSPSVSPDTRGHVAPQVTCGTGSNGCAGTITATAGHTTLGTVQFELKEESSAAIRFPTPAPSGSKEIAFQVKATDGFSSPDPVTLPVQ
jgi:hypothetical protein